ncbi:hypothetical protein CEUSTIGMA_g10350.t1 [Chlamydomonas eustigma]|uniref:Uncharacterized protein n=1 Tax=Chlamydomonas eustigma TaxID=1157962 RepID=A0A250XIQ6_9CHLO|nr:hypothetical protein CEUSTIGMA_g10350.t1 [Chlamydomonas eustigma]|eukprot:GAX82923.1 hypothetical protein CEUSTIGMA_g10350.t1 [Chlamydomonas eustigma]
MSFEDAPPLLVPILSVGVSNVPGAVAVLEKDVIAYVSGHCVATCSVGSSHRVRISEPTSSVRSITAMSTSSDRQWLAVAEFMTGGRGPQITILDATSTCLARKQSLTGPDVFKYIHLSFSEDDKSLIAVGPDDDQKHSIFHVWDLTSSSTTPACSGTVSDEVTKVSIHPKFQANVITQSGEEVILWRKAVASFKRLELHGLHKTPSGTYTDHCWLTDGRLVVATSDKRIFIVEANQVSEEHVLGRSIVCLLSMPGNHLMVSMAKGNMAMYRCNKDGGPMSIATSLSAPESSGTSLDNSILHIAHSMDGNKVAAFPKNGPIFMVDINLALHSLSPEDNKSDLWEEALPSLHSAGITSLSLATKRDFLATASADDLTVRVWQFNPLRLVVTHYCHHSPLTLGMDPWGRELIICYVDCCRCYSIVEGMLMEMASLLLDFSDGKGPVEMPRSSIVKYNPTGHMIALTAGVGGKDIAIFSTLFHKQIALLRGHFTSIKDIAWSEDGLYLVSCSDGEVYTWHMETFSKSQSSNVKSYPSSSVVCTADFSTLIVGEGNQGVRILQTKRALKQPGSISTSGASAFNAAAAVAGSRRGSIAGQYPTGQYPTGGVGEGAVSGGGEALRSSISRAGSRASGGEFRVPNRATIVEQAAKADQDAAATSMAMSVTGSSSPTSRPPSPSMLMRAGKALAMTKSLTLVQGLGSGERRVAIAAGASGTPMSELQASSAAMPAASSDSSDLSTLSIYTSVMSPSRACLALMECTGHWRAIVGAEMLGRARVCTLPPKSNSHFQEYSLHHVEITSMVSHRDGRILFTGDSSGCWKMHALIPFSAAVSPALAMAINQAPAPAAQATPSSSLGNLLTAEGSSTSVAAAMAASAPGGLFGMVPAYGDMVNAIWKLTAELGYTERKKQATQLVSVRMVDLNGLKESVRELKDKMSKAAASSEYKLYQRENEVRREMDGELTHWKSEAEEVQGQLRTALKELNYVKESHLAAEQQLKAEMEEALQVERDAFMTKYAIEIERTNIAETSMEKAKAKFGKKLWEIEEERAAGARAASVRAVELEANVVAAKVEAEKIVKKSQKQMELEARVDFEVNEEEISRVSNAASSAIDTEKTRLEVLLAKFTLQAGLYHKTLKDNEDLMDRNEQLVKEKEILASQSRGLMQELETMKEAWQERDVRQRVMEAELKELMQQNQQAVLFTNLANSRIQDLKDELDPVKMARSMAQETIVKMEELQIKQAEARVKATMEHENLKHRYEVMKAELKQTRIKLDAREDYFKNFTTQLFRTIHTVGHEQWSYVFGRLYKDYVAGKDLANWSKYLPDKSGITKGSAVSVKGFSGFLSSGLPTASSSPSMIIPGGNIVAEKSSVTDSSSSDADRATIVTAASPVPQKGSWSHLALMPNMMQQSEWETQMKELQMHVKHLEKNLAHTKEGRDRSEAAQKLVIQRLVTENMTVIEESNTYKRELRMVREQLDRSLAELQLVKANPSGAQSSGYGAAQLRRAASNTSSISAVSSGSGLHRLAASGIDNGEAAWHELSSSEMQAAAAAARASSSSALRPSTSQGFTAISASLQSSGAQPYPRTIQSGTRIPTILEDGPSRTPAAAAAAAAAAAGTARSGATPHSTTVVTGDMPKGGWWLGDNLFEVPASLSSALSKAPSEASSRPSTTMPAPDTSSATASPFVQPRRPGTSQGGSRLGSRPAFAPATPSNESHPRLGPPLRPPARQASSSDTNSLSSPSSALPGGTAIPASSWEPDAETLVAAESGGRAETAPLVFNGRRAVAGMVNPISPQRRPGTSPATSATLLDMASVTEEDGRPNAKEQDADGAGDHASEDADNAAAVASVPPPQAAAAAATGTGGGGIHAVLKGVSPPIKSTRVLPPAFLNLIQGQVKAPTLTNSIRMSTLGGGFRSFRGRTNNN